MDTVRLDAPLDPALRPFIDQAVHAVVAAAARHGDTDASARCADYAIIGARLLMRLTGLAYQPVAGMEVIDCGGGRYISWGPERRQRRQARKLEQVKFYHCWIQAAHPADGGQRLEIVDFAARHSAAAVRWLGEPYVRDDDGDYLWAWSDEIAPCPIANLARWPRAQKSCDWLWQDPACTRLLRQYAQENDTLFERLSLLALEQLLARLEACAHHAPALQPAA